MKKLLKTYGFNSDMQYFERIVRLHKTKDLAASKLMFKDMPLGYKKNFINANLGNWQSGLDNSDLAIFVSLI